MDKTLTKGILILELLANSRGARGITEISRELELSKSNTHRLLQTLAALGYATSIEGRYSLTPRIYALGTAVLQQFDVRRLALPEIERLAEETAETVHLSIPDKDEVIYIEKIDSLQPMRVHTAIGGRAPAYCTSTGKALLAFQPKRLVAEVCRDLRSFTKQTITDQHSLVVELAKVRKLGYAVNRGEWHAEIGGVASPIFDANAVAVAAIGVSGPTVRLTKNVIRKLVPLVCKSAQTISVNMGAVLAEDGLPLHLRGRADAT